MSKLRGAERKASASAQPADKAKRSGRGTRKKRRKARTGLGRRPATPSAAPGTAGWTTRATWRWACPGTGERQRGRKARSQLRLKRSDWRGNETQGGQDALHRSVQAAQESLKRARQRGRRQQRGAARVAKRNKRMNWAVVAPMAVPDGVGGRAGGVLCVGARARRGARRARRNGAAHHRKRVVGVISGGAGRRASALRRRAAGGGAQRRASRQRAGGRRQRRAGCNSGKRRSDAPRSRAASCRGRPPRLRRRAQRSAQRHRVKRRHNGVGTGARVVNRAKNARFHASADGGGVMAAAKLGGSGARMLSVWSSGCRSPAFPRSLRAHSARSRLVGASGSSSDAACRNVLNESRSGESAN